MDLICKGKVKDALRCLSGEGRGGVHSLSWKAQMRLNQSWMSLRTNTRPVGLHQSTLCYLAPLLMIPLHVFFHALDDKAIRQAAIRTRGSAGPSGVDATAWKCWCTSYGKASVGLCRALAAVGRLVCMGFIDPSVLRAFKACCLIPLDMNPGVHLIGVVEVCHRIIGKAVMGIVKLDLIEAAAGRQFCAGWWM